ncbi:MAG: class I SAM-dependent methyltransferase [Flavobacteriales bacterium]|jgi:SAM-dependent methyltransferase|nr:class I SAM-dependent methyltransferase [Flavobacteriales bacterium]
MGEPSRTAFNIDQFDAIYPTGVERHYWNQCRNAVILASIRSIGDHGPVLEVGCGKGLVVSYLRAQGLEVTGVELAQVKPLPEVEAHVRTGTDAMKLDVSERALVKTVLLLDVIEHLEDAGAFMQQLRAGFPALRYFVITVPARQELFSNYDTFNGHFRRYDLKLLNEHVADGNATVLRASYFFHALYPAAWIQLRLSGKRSLAFSVPPPGPVSWVHAVIGRLFFLEQRAIPRSCRGTSLIAAAKLNGR